MLSNLPSHPQQECTQLNRYRYSSYTQHQVAPSRGVHRAAAVTVSVVTMIMRVMLVMTLGQGLVDVGRDQLVDVLASDINLQSREV